MKYKIHKNNQINQKVMNKAYHNIKYIIKQIKTINQSIMMITLSKIINLIKIKKIYLKMI